jgi:hypothetical protein
LETLVLLFWLVTSHLCTFQDADASIRKRALELVFLLVNDTNVKPLTKELVDYLDVADPDFKEDLTAKICSITEKLVSSFCCWFPVDAWLFNEVAL